MNQKNKPLTNAMFEAESSEALERLDEIEQRLKATRPQPPRLDVAALQRLADDAKTDAVVERPIERTSRRSMSRRRRRIGRRVLLIAGSWACGAAVGAIVMFTLMSRAVPETGSENEVVNIEKKAPDSIAHVLIADHSDERESDPKNGPAAVDPSESRVTNAAMLTAVLDSLGRSDSTYLADGPTLQVGMYRRRHAEPSMWPFVSAVRKDREFSRDREPGDFKPWTKSKYNPEPESAVTPRELMRKLLGETSGPVL